VRPPSLIQATDLEGHIPANADIGSAPCGFADARDGRGGMDLSDGRGQADDVRSACLTLPGQASQVRVVRQWLTGFVAGLPAAADVVLAASELAANAVCHSDSGRHGGTFTIRVAVRSERVRVEVADAGGPWRLRLGWADPRPGDARLDGARLDGARLEDQGCGDQIWGDYGDGPSVDHCGRGLAIVASLATDWGIVGDQRGRTAWFELSAQADRPGVD
jgi:serine/threonine-protein kinase RsbW